MISSVLPCGSHSFLAEVGAVAFDTSAYRALSLVSVKWQLVTAVRGTLEEERERESERRGERVREMKERERE